MEVKVQRHQIYLLSPHHWYFPHYVALVARLLHLMSLHWHTSIAQSWCKSSPFGQIFHGIKPPPQCPPAQVYTVLKVCCLFILPLLPSNTWQPLSSLLWSHFCLLQRCIVGSTPYVAFADWFLLLPSIKYIFRAWDLVSLYHHIPYITFYGCTIVYLPISPPQKTPKYYSFLQTDKGVIVSELLGTYIC